VRSQRRQQFLEGEAVTVGVREDARREARELAALPLGRPCPFGADGDERSDAAARFDDARALEVGVSAGHRVRVDAEVHRQLAYDRHLPTSDGTFPD
jgi:hypothetical protein